MHGEHEAGGGVERDGQGLGSRVRWSLVSALPTATGGHSSHERDVAGSNDSYPAGHGKDEAGPRVGVTSTRHDTR